MGAGRGFVIVIAGRQDTGKTTFAKTLIQAGRPVFVYDFRAEYGGKAKQPFGEFIKQANNKRETTIIIEEATVFLSNRGDNEDVKNLLAGRSHDGNTIVIIFHSLRTVPTYILDLCDYYVLFKTNDNEQLISNKFKFNDQLLEDFQTVKQSQDPHFHIVRRLIL